MKRIHLFVYRGLFEAYMGLFEAYTPICVYWALLSVYGALVRVTPIAFRASFLSASSASAPSGLLFNSFRLSGGMKIVSSLANGMLSAHFSTAHGVLTGKKLSKVSSTVSFYSTHSSDQTIANIFGMQLAHFPTAPSVFVGRNSCKFTTKCTVENEWRADVREMLPARRNSS